MIPGSDTAYPMKKMSMHCNTIYKLYMTGLGKTTWNIQFWKIRSSSIPSQRFKPGRPRLLFWRRPDDSRKTGCQRSRHHQWKSSSHELQNQLGPSIFQDKRQTPYVDLVEATHTQWSQLLLTVMESRQSWWHSVTRTPPAFILAQDPRHAEPIILGSTAANRVVLPGM